MYKTRNFLMNCEMGKYRDSPYFVHTHTHTHTHVKLAEQKIGEADNRNICCGVLICPQDNERKIG